MPNFGVEIPFVRLLGFVLKRMQGGESELSYEAQAAHLNSFGVVHGGATMALLDVAMATAARSLPPALGVVTVEMKTSFMQPARGPLLARGRVLHRTASLAFAEGLVFDAQGRLCSQASGTFKYVRRAPPEGPAAIATD